MHHQILLTGLVGLVAHASSAAVGFDNLAHIAKREMNPNSVCSTFGVDFQSGGSYFINKNSSESFTFVSEFEGCNNDVAYLMLVNKDTTDQWDCGTVPTVPANTPQIATCQVLKSQLISGSYLIIANGNNGDGEPFSYQREFTLDVGTQQTITAFPTVTVTSTPVVTQNSTTFVNSTTTIPNSFTVTLPSATHVLTTTPAKVTTTQIRTITQTFDRWTKFNSVTTVTVTPTCHVPLRPRHPDPICKSLPRGVKPHKNHHPRPPRGGKHEQQHGPRDAPAFSPLPSLKKRAPDARSTTTTVIGVTNATVTITAVPSTQTLTVVATSSFTTTALPQTVRDGQAVQTVGAPAPTETIVQVVYTRTYVTKTFGFTWTKTVVTTPAALKTDCARRGGRLGDQWW